MKSRYEIEAKTLEHRNTTDEREATGATGQPKHALEALRSKMLELMDEAGLTHQVLIEKYLVPLFDATTTKFCTYKGKISDSVIVPDNHAQLRALDIALRLHGA